jgi:hypothetical protein
MKKIKQHPIRLGVVFMAELHSYSANKKITRPTGQVIFNGGGHGTRTAQKSSNQQNKLFLFYRAKV